MHLERVHRQNVSINEICIILFFLLWLGLLNNYFPFFSYLAAFGGNFSFNTPATAAPAFGAPQTTQAAGFGQPSFGPAGKHLHFYFNSTELNDINQATFNNFEFSLGLNFYQ